MKQKIVRRASALVLAGCLLAGAALPALAASAKEEVIYANLDASGTVTGVYAVNSFAVQAGDTVTDHGSYTAVRNMTTTDPLEHSGDTVTAAVAEDGKLYYEGTMDTATALPWLVKLTYTLDGAEIAPEELGGKSGALTIRLQVSRNPDCTGDFFDQYALQVTMTLDTDRAQNIVADGATMANVGSNKQLSYILLPGSDSDVTVTADVTDFAMNAISLNGVKLRLNLGLDGADLTGMLDRLQSGSVQLDDGANALADGIAQVQAGLDTLNGKSGELTGGSAKVKAALTQMQTALNGVSASTDQLTTLLDASTQIQNGIAQLDAGAAQLDEQVSYDAYKAILKENGLDLDQLKDGNAKAMEQLEQLARVMPQLKDVILLLKGSSANIDAMETYLNTVHDGVAQLHAGSSTLNSQYGQFDAGVRQLANALTGMLGNLSVLTDGVNQLASQYGQLDSGLNAYTDGVAQLKAGVQQLTDGAAQLTAGTGELRSNVSGIDMSDQLDSLLAGLQVAPDDPDADALAALCAQTEPATALTLLEELLQRQQAAQEAAAASLADTEARLDAIQQQLGAARQAAQLARQLAEQQAALDAARPALDAAKAESARHADDAARLDALTGQVTQARTALTAYDELDALCREQKQAQDAAQLAGALAAKRRTQLEALDASLAAADTALAVLVDAPTRQLALQNQAAQLEARSTALDALAQRLADSQKQARQARRAQDAYRAAAARQDEARARRDALDRAFLDAQAGLLAQELTEGAPCPVCGSTHHPARAVLPRTAPTQVQVEQARQAAEEADHAAQTASAAAQSALAAADEARRSLRRDAEALLPERFAAPEGKPPVQLTFALMNTVLSEETAALQAARTDCTASLRQAGADCQRKAQLEADRQAHTRQRPALEQQVQEADRTAAAQSARVQALEQQVLAKQKALPYPQRAQAQAALDLLEANRTALRAGMEQAEAALRTAQQNYAAAKAAVDALRSQQAAAQSSAPAQPLETLREAAAELTAARDAARGQEKQLAARLLFQSLAHDVHAEQEQGQAAQERKNVEDCHMCVPHFSLT